MGTFITQVGTPDLYLTKVPAPGATIPPGLTAANVVQAADMNALEGAVLDARVAIRGMEANVRHYGAVGDGVADDTAALQAALTAGAGGVVLFSGGRYRVTSKLVVSGDNTELRFTGGATLVSALGVNPTTDFHPLFVVIGVTPVYRTQNAVPTANIAAGATAISFNSGDLASVQVGDFARVKTTKVDSITPAYKLGTLRPIVAVGATSVTLDGPVTDATAVVADGVQVDFIRPLRGLRVLDMRVELQSGFKQTGAYFQYVDDFALRGGSFDGVGGESYIGLWVEGTDVRVADVTAKHFRDTFDFSHGYGVQVSGHDVVVRDCRLIDCKHGVTCGNNDYHSTGLHYTGNWCQDAMLDAHGNSSYVRMSLNRIEGVGQVAGPFAVGLWLRGKHMEATRNTITGAQVQATAAHAMRLQENAIEDVTLAGNTVVNCEFGIHGDNLAAPAVGVSILDNNLDVYGRGIFLDDTSSCVISGNRIESGLSGIEFKGGDDVVVTGNRIRYAKVGSAAGIQPQFFTSRTCERISICNNAITAGGASADNAIRPNQRYGSLNISNNTINMAAAPSVAGIRLTDDSGFLTKLVMSGNIGQGSLGSATWDPPNITPGNSATTTLAIPGIQLGATVVASFSQVLPGFVALRAWVSAVGVVTVSLDNHTAASSFDLASGIVRVEVLG